MNGTNFNLQMFGTNDTITSSNDLQIEFGFADGDTRTIKLPNPKPNLDSATFVGLSSWMTTKNIIIGDKAGASSTGINSAVIIDQTKVKLDLS